MGHCLLCLLPLVGRHSACVHPLAVITVSLCVERDLLLTCSPLVPFPCLVAKARRVRRGAPNLVLTCWGPCECPLRLEARYSSAMSGGISSGHFVRKTEKAEESEAA